MPQPRLARVTAQRDAMDRTAVADVTPSGAFARKESTFRNSFDVHGPHPPERDRYVLVVSLACPWACRALSVLHLKGLENVFKVVVTHPVWARTRPEDANDAHCGWVFVKPGESIANPAGVGHFVADGRCSSSAPEDAKFVRDLYELCGAPKEQRFTVPLIWDTKARTIVNNESSEIIREMNTNFNAFSSSPERAALDLYPEALRERIDDINGWVYHRVNNGVYKCGFAVTQEAYDQAVKDLFEALDDINSILSESRYLCGDVFTEADVRLWQTLIRFDEVYVVYFKTNKKFIHQYEHISGYVRELWQMPELRAATNMDHIKTHYFASHPSLNAHAIIPIGPGVNLDAPHGREGDYPRK